MYVFCFFSELVFETEAGVGLMHFHMKDLQPSMLVGASIVNCFASMLNFEETKRTPGTLPRLFCHTDCFVSLMGHIFQLKSYLYMLVPC